MENTKESLWLFQIIDNGDSFSLKKTEIKDLEYSTHLFHPRIHFNGRKHGISTYSNDNIRVDKLDRVVHMKLFTFNPDEDEANRIISQHFRQALEAANERLRKCERNLLLWKNRSK